MAYYCPLNLQGIWKFEEPSSYYEPIKEYTLHINFSFCIVHEHTTTSTPYASFFKGGFSPIITLWNILIQVLSYHD